MKRKNKMFAMRLTKEFNDLILFKAKEAGFKKKSKYIESLILNSGKQA